MTTNTNAALRSAAESALEALEILNGIDTETESVTIHVSDEIAALRAALTAAAAPAAVAGPSAPTLERLREWEKNGELMERVWGTLVEQENEIKRLTAAPTTQAAPQREVFDEDGFRAWVIRNLPDNTIIGNSTWWAGHLAAWVQRFMLAAPQAAPVAQGDARPRSERRKDFS